MPYFIIDCGSFTLKYGMSDAPEPSRLDSAIYVPKKNGDPNTPHPLYIGDEAMEKRGLLLPKRAIESGLIINLDAFKSLVSSFFKDSETRVVLCASTDNRDLDRVMKTVFEYLLELNVPAVMLVDRCEAAFLSSGSHTGLLVHLGYCGTEIVAFKDGAIVHRQSEKDVYSAKNVDEKLWAIPSLDSAKVKGLNIPGIKEALCYVRGGEAAAPAAEYTLHDGRTAVVDGDLRWQCNEFFFNPSLVLSEHSPGIVQEIVNTIHAIKDDALRGEMWGNILLAGGVSRTKGMLDRVKDELRKGGHDHARVSLVPHGGDATWRGAAALTDKQLKWMTAESFSVGGEHKHK